MTNIQRNANALRANLLIWYAANLISRHTPSDVAIYFKYLSVALALTFIYLICTTAWKMFGKLKALFVIVISMIPIINIALVYYLVKKSKELPSVTVTSKSMDQVPFELNITNADQSQIDTSNNSELNEDGPQTAEQVAKRALVLSAVITAAYGSPVGDIISWLNKENLYSELTPNELEFLNDPTNKKHKINMTWKLEALVVLLWSISKLEKLPHLTNQCDTEPLKKAVVWPPYPTSSFIETSILRSKEIIESEYENVYQAHWKVRDAKINGKKVPEELVPGVVLERHYGFNWIIGYDGQQWDDIATDT